MERAISRRCAVFFEKRRWNRTGDGLPPDGKPRHLRAGTARGGAKHKDSNGEENRDGADHNLSWNCGIEGPTADPAVERLRNRQVKNFFTLTLLATGTPMLLMGDEARRTQMGNNNAFCQNNEISWFNWSLIEEHADIHRFVKELIALRMNRSLPVEG